MLGTEAAQPNVRALPSFGKGIVAGIEVFAFFEFVLEEVCFVGKLAI
jgi:hypothetical protein